MPFASIDALFAWTAIGPFEWGLHALGAFVTTILATLKMENYLNITWNNAFIPLYIMSGRAAPLLFVHIFRYGSFKPIEDNQMIRVAGDGLFVELNI